MRFTRMGCHSSNVLILMLTWSQGASVHILRHVIATSGWARSANDLPVHSIEKLLSTSTTTQVSLDESQRMQVFLKIKDNGLGFGSATARRGAAYIGAWEGGMKPLLSNLSTVARGE